jgi:hypothetical protein
MTARDQEFQTEITSIARIAERIHEKQGELATVRGTVSLTSPTLFVQDDTGGIALPDPICASLESGR